MKACYHRANKFSRGNYLAWILIIMFMSIGTITDIGLKDISTNVLIARADSDPQNMDWIDDSLQQPILNELKNEGKISQNSTTFSKNDIANMTSLDTGDQAVESLRGLEYATNLTTLKISNDGQSNPIYDLSPLSGLTKLTTLSIANSDISDISPLTNLVNLTDLNLSSNNINDVSSLSKLTKLASLDLSHNQIDDISSLGNLTSLESLKLDSNDLLDDLDSLGNLNNLSYLSASYLPKLSDIDFLKGNPKLSYLHLSDDNINDISSLEQNKFLTDIDLDDNHISDLSPLRYSFGSNAQDNDNFSAYGQTIPENALIIDTNGNSISVNKDKSFNNASYNFTGQATLPAIHTHSFTNKQSITGTDFTTHIGSKIPNATDFKASATDKDGNSEPVSVDLSKADLLKTGTYHVILTTADGQSKTVFLIVERATPVKTIVCQGQAILGINKIYLYKMADFNKYNRLFAYKKQNRNNRPMFVVVGYKRSKNHALRYKVRDVNHGSKTYNRYGYITANNRYITPAYYSTLPKIGKITVINPTGINAYKSISLTQSQKHYKFGKILQVIKLKKYHLTTRYILKNGDYITANRKLVSNNYKN